MKKVLWLSNYRFQDSQNSGSGTWIESMGKALVKSGRFKMCNITLGNVKKLVRDDACGIKQWIFPIQAVVSKALWEMPPDKILRGICEIAGTESPDLVHVWGVERFWGLLTARKMIAAPALLEMQGLPSAMAPYMTGCLEQSALRKCFRLKELLRPALSLSSQQKRFRLAVDAEREMIHGHRFIDYQSEWIRDNIEPWRNGAELLKTRMMLRSDFLESTPWRYKQGNQVVFTSCGWAVNKGLHVLIEACKILRGRYPNLQLRVAGGFGQGIRQSGYQKYVMHLAKGLDMVRLGALSPEQMINEIHNAAVYVNPSLVESYSMSLAEAMAVGCPCVATYAGAMPEVGGQQCLYFPVGDTGSCSGAIRQIFELGEKAQCMGNGGRRRSLNMHDEYKCVNRQIEIYEHVFSSVE